MVPTEGKMDLQTCVCLENKTENRTCRHATKCWGLEGIAIVWKHEMKILWLVLLKLQICMITIYNTVWTNMIQYVHTSRHASITIIYIYDIWLLYITYILLCLKRPWQPEKRATAETLHEWFVRKMPKRQKLLERQGPPLGASDVYQAGLVGCLSFCFSSLYLIVSDHQCSWYLDGWFRHSIQERPNVHSLLGFMGIFHGDLQLAVTPFTSWPCSWLSFTKSGSARVVCLPWEPPTICSWMVNF